MTDEEWAKFSSNFHKSDEGSGGAGGQSLGGQVWDAAKGVGEGALKEVGGFIDPQTDLSKGSTDWYGGLRDWSASDDPSHPQSEKIGRFGADILPSMMTPEIPLAGLAAKAGLPIAAAPLWRAMAAHPNLVGKGEKLLQDTWKGAVGGAEQNAADPGQGAGTGGVTGAALGFIPRVPKIAVPMAMGASLLEHGKHFGPWAYYHMLAPLAALARGAQAAGPGVAGAVVEKADKSRLRENPDQKSYDNWSPGGQQ